jgi:hypothetical protein
MPQFQAVGPGPISLLNSTQAQIELPLSLVYFDSGVAKVSSAWTPYAANQAVVDALLKQLVSEGVIFAGTTVVSAPTPALTLTAVQQGNGGNFLSVTFANPNITVTPNTIDVTVTVAENFPGLTTATIGAALGTSDATANGLVFLASPPPGPAPAAATNVVTASGGAPYQIDIPEASNSANTALALQVIAAAATTIATAVKVSVVPDSSDPNTFALTVNWSQTATGQNLTTLEGAGNPFSTLVTFSGPASGPLPAPGTVILQGGGPASDATHAKASALSA